MPDEHVCPSPFELAQVVYLVAVFCIAVSHFGEFPILGTCYFFCGYFAQLVPHLVSATTSEAKWLKNRMVVLAWATRILMFLHIRSIDPREARDLKDELPWMIDSAFAALCLMLS